MTKYFIVTVDSLVDTFSIVKAGSNIYVEFKTNDNNIFNTIEKGDKILGIYNNCVKYIFIMQKVTEKDKIVLKKYLEFDNDIKIDEIYQNYEIKEINKEEFNRIYNEILLNLSIDISYLYELENKEFTLKKNNNIMNEIDYNQIVYGIPGCGKSYHVENKILKEVDKNNNVIRTTFFPDYSNSDFIGQILPFVKDKDVTYKYVPGPFTKSLEKAYKNKNEMFYLVIEEINRGNAAAIFGDVFQLLDRLKKNSDDERVKGDSEYPISNEFIEGYLRQEKVNFTPERIHIPHNLVIIATMNTSDQNVFPLDTAFKRRWKMERITNTWDENHPFANYYIPFTNITWKNFVETINEKMLELTSDGLYLEDKQLGEYFANEEMFIKNKADAYIVNDENEKKLKNFTYKVIEYLYNDVFKFNKDKFFKETTISFNKLCESIIKFNEKKTEYIGMIETCMDVNFDVSNDEGFDVSNDEGIEDVIIEPTDEVAGE